MPCQQLKYRFGPVVCIFAVVFGLSTSRDLQQNQTQPLSTNFEVLNATTFNTSDVS